MTNRHYRLVYGALLLIALYLELPFLVYALIGLPVIEVITNQMIPKLVSQIGFAHEVDPHEGTLGIDFKIRTNFEAERGFRLTVATMLCLSIFIYPDALWFLPWFMGFAIFGAGISGVCPVFLMMKWLGLK